MAIFITNRKSYLFWYAVAVTLREDLQLEIEYEFLRFFF